MEMIIHMDSFTPLSTNEILEIDGGINWDRVFGGVTVYLTATMAICTMTTPIGWGLGATYLAISAVAGAYTGYGLVT